MKKIVLLLANFLSAALVFGQEQPGLTEVADKHFYKYEYSLAAPLYERLLARRKAKTDWMYKAAFSYESMQRYDKAVYWYTRLLQKDSSAKAEVYLHTADLAKMLEKYDSAILVYKDYLRKGGDAKIAADRIKGCELATQWKQSPTAHTIANYESVNSPLSEWGTTFYGNELVFTSEQARELSGTKIANDRDVYEWNNNPFLNLYVTNNFKQGAGIARLLETVNEHDYHVGPAVFTKNNDTLYFTRTYRRANHNFEKPMRRLKVGTRKLELMYSVKKDIVTWTKPQPVIPGKGTVYSIGHATLSPGGDVLYFASDMPGGYGKTDIWYCEKKANHTWGDPVNCGPVINTPDEEEFPVIDANGDLYFASTGHVGMGGFDVFRASGEKGNWADPGNMRYPVNTSYDDFYYIPRNNREMYLSSNRPGGKGSDDIYYVQFSPPPPPAPAPPAPPKRKWVVLKAVVSERASQAALEEATTMLMDKGREYMGFTGKNGVVYYTLDCNTAYSIRSYKDGYSKDSAVISAVDCGTADTITVPMQLYATVQPKESPKNKPAEPRYKVGDAFVLKDLYYDLDKYNIRPDAAKVLDSLVLILKKYPGMTIELSSHTDSRANDAYNEKLSKNRAASAVGYLVSKGISPARLVAAGYGERRLRNGCANNVPCTEKQHQENRRTEVKVLKMDSSPNVP